MMCEPFSRRNKELREEVKRVRGMFEKCEAKHCLRADGRIAKNAKALAAGLSQRNKELREEVKRVCGMMEKTEAKHRLRADGRIAETAKALAAALSVNGRGFLGRLWWVLSGR